MSLLFAASLTAELPQEIPDLEFLEFLGEWQSDGELLDPEMFEDGSLPPVAVPATDHEDAQH